MIKSCIFVVVARKDDKSHCSVFMRLKIAFSTNFLQSCNVGEFHRHFCQFPKQF